MEPAQASCKLLFMKSSFRGKLTLLFFGLSLAPLAVSTAYFLSVYKNDKLAALFETELNTTLQGASRIENLITTARVFGPDEIRDSRDIIMMADRPCALALTAAHSAPQNPVLVVSSVFEQTLNRLKLNPEAWIRTEKVAETCIHSQKEKFSNPRILTQGPKFSLPYVQFFLQNPKAERIVTISMEGLGGASASSLHFIMSPEGKLIWSDGTKTELATFKTTDFEELAKFTTQALSSRIPSVTKLPNSKKIVAYAPISTGFVLFSITDEDEALAPVIFFLKQSILFALGCLFLSLLVGKLTAQRISKPLEELRTASTNFGSGDLKTRISVKGTDEIAQVQTTFNLMADKIGQLIEDTKVKAAIESDIAIAQKVQHWFFPGRALKTATHELHSSIQMAQSCGGDWWGLLEVPRPESSPLLLVMIGDAAGHGISSALLTAATQGAISLLSLWITNNPAMASDPVMLLNSLNSVLYQTTRGEIHMTFLVAVLDTTAETITVANAGHNKPYLLTPKPNAIGAEVIPLGSASPVVGAKAQEDFPPAQVYPWKYPSQIFLYTDGLIDCRKGEKDLFDRRALTHLLKKAGHLRRDALNSHILKERKKLIGSMPESDDITAVLCARLPSTTTSAPAPEVKGSTT